MAALGRQDSKRPTLSYLGTTDDEVLLKVGSLDEGDWTIDSTTRTLPAALDINGGNTKGLRIRPRTAAGAPTTGKWTKGSLIVDAAGEFYLCTADGTPGTWTNVTRGKSAVVGNWSERTVIRNLPSTVGDAVDIGTLTFHGGVGSSAITVNASATGYSTKSKYYIIPIRWNGYGGGTVNNLVVEQPAFDTRAHGANSLPVVGDRMVLAWGKDNPDALAKKLSGSEILLLGDSGVVVVPWSDIRSEAFEDGVMLYIKKSRIPPGVYRFAELRASGVTIKSGEFELRISKEVAFASIGAAMGLMFIRRKRRRSGSITSRSTFLHCDQTGVSVSPAGLSRMTREPQRMDGQERGPATTDKRVHFDVFLSHNGKDKPAVHELKRQLALHGLRSWLDEDELQPGIPWQKLLEIGIETSGSIAVLVGKDGVGPWENEEMQAALCLAVDEGRPVIPVLLPGAPSQPKLPMFLSNRTWVDLRGGQTEASLRRLVWGITGKKP